LPQAPQFALSLARSLHCPLHEVWPLGQTHAPPLQVWPAGQAAPQLPQWSRLVVRSTQSLPHWVWPLAQVDAQLPPEQTSRAPHATPQPPQLPASELVSTQVPEQVTRPSAHVQPPF
jgi:hypothetical protein